jgi:threonine dehydrogenase-like Zn-dependent dehydrogenase
MAMMEGLTMKAVAVFPGTKEIKLIETEPPNISSPTQVKLRMLEVGICGTDKEICAFEYGTPPPGFDHLIIGHESLGEVVEVGPEVANLKPGNLVVPMVRRPCPREECVACRAGRQDFCFTGDFTERGIKEAHGYMTGWVVEEERYMATLPDPLREVGILVEPLTIAEKALIQVWDIQERLPWGRHEGSAERGRGYRALVLGAGPVGLLGAMALANAGFETHVYSREKQGGPKSGIVEAIGARYISAQDEPVSRLPGIIGNIDVVYEATGATRLSFEVIENLGTNGIFIFTGVPGRKAPIEVDADDIMRNVVLKNQVILGTVNAGLDAFESAIRDLGVFLKRWPDAVRSLVTGRHPIEAHRDLLFGKAGGIKNVIVLGGES